MMLKTALIFQQGMVLQCEKPVPVWGCCEPNAQISVSFMGQEWCAISDADGNFTVTLDPLPVCLGSVMTIRSGKEEIVFSDVQVGEVWLASGQSNMEFHMRYDCELNAALEQPNESIRFFDYPKVSYPGQINEAHYQENYGIWLKAVPEVLERFSAAGYWFANHLWSQYRVPIGIIGCSWGGSPAVAWMDEAHIISGGGSIWLEEYAEQTKALDIAAYKTAYQSEPRAHRLTQFADPAGDLMMYGVPLESLEERLKQQGYMLDKLSVPEILTTVGPYYEHRPAGLRYSMLEPLVPYAIRGVLWYQGETDGDFHPEVYHTLFPALIANWRELWQENLPFLFVQLAPLDHWGKCTGEPYVIIRNAQQETVETVARTGMAVITDAGMEFDIHPKRKRPVGERLALLAEKIVYGNDVLCEAPTLVSAAVQPGKLTLRFINCGNGLVLNGQELNGLQIFQNGTKLTNLSATAGRDTVTVISSEIEAGPVEIHLAKTGWYNINLWNSAGLPARPASITCPAEVSNENYPT